MLRAVPGRRACPRTVPRRGGRLSVEHAAVPIDRDALLGSDDEGALGDPGMKPRSRRSGDAHFRADCEGRSGGSDERAALRVTHPALDADSYSSWRPAARDSGGRGGTGWRCRRRRCWLCESRGSSVRHVGGWHIRSDGGAVEQHLDMRGGGHHTVAWRRSWTPLRARHRRCGDAVAPGVNEARPRRHGSAACRRGFGADPGWCCVVDCRRGGRDSRSPLLLARGVRRTCSLRRGPHRLRTAPRRRSPRACRWDVRLVGRWDDRSGLHVSAAARRFVV
ncbi:hypothetical protein SAMN05660766_0586 [Curtobacterium sp. 314Chir4.1]|nr:hypothetical protein SAMN05660766_0586 [Curtobacterium sp. 314Chir4.1]